VNITFAHVSIIRLLPLSQLSSDVIHSHVSAAIILTRGRCCRERRLWGI